MGCEGPCHDQTSWPDFPRFRYPYEILACRPHFVHLAVNSSSVVKVWGYTMAKLRTKTTICHVRSAICIGRG